MNLRHRSVPAAATLLLSLLATSPVATSQAPPKPEAATPPPAVAATEGMVPRGPLDTGFRTLGSPDAPVTIIEFTDLQCPYCARFAQQTWPQIKARYVDTGKVRFASRDLPLPMHPQAQPAAIAARCAGRQGKFWEYREALFAEQGRLAQQPWDDLAGRLGLDLPAFKACRADPTMPEAIQEDVAVAQRNGILGTPSFVVGRLVDGNFEAQLIRGAQSFEAFEKAIEATLAGGQQPQP
jgi:protein-disulfide isomerase